MIAGPHRYCLSHFKFSREQISLNGLGQVATSGLIIYAQGTMLPGTPFPWTRPTLPTGCN